ncbi:MAG: DUF2569 domain-containing protein [Novosphingobium sp.]
MACNRLAYKVEQRSLAIPRALGSWIDTIAIVWAAVFLFASLPKLIYPVTPVGSIQGFLALALPYVIIALAPLAGFRVASGSFPGGAPTAQPEIRLAIFGRWRKLSVLDARAHPVFGPAGLMASLMIGLLINIVFRSFEFLLAIPAIDSNGPFWGRELFLYMTADVAVMGFFYMVCFVMALRTAPLFPRMLLFAWGLDICSQLIIASHIGGMRDLPVSVALPLRQLLEGNIHKVLISAFVWLPYLILSERVNVTYRQRTERRSPAVSVN